VRCKIKSRITAHCNGNLIPILDVCLFRVRASLRMNESEVPLVASVCGTFLKPEMQSIFRQVTGLHRFRTIVFTEELSHPDQFPFAPVEVLVKLPRPKPRGNLFCASGSNTSSASGRRPSGSKRM